MTNFIITLTALFCMALVCLLPSAAQSGCNAPPALPVWQYKLCEAPDSSAAAASVRAGVKKISLASGIQPDFDLLPCESLKLNCLASCVNGRQAIIYNPIYWRDRNCENHEQVQEDAFALIELAQTTGHIANGHLSSAPAYEAMLIRQELDACSFAGWVCCRMGLSFQQVQAFYEKRAQQAAASGPSRADVLKALASGWSDADCISGGSSMDNFTDPWAGAMIAVRGGSFSMGNELGKINSRPVHVVQVPDFFIRKYELSIAEFDRFVKESGYETDAEVQGSSMIWTRELNTWREYPGINWRHDPEGRLRSRSEYNHPVVHVSWNDAMAYAAWLSKKTGRSYSLPSEAEWEYAAKGGRYNSSAPYAGGREIPALAWYKGNSGQAPHPVGQKMPNELKIHDQTGNVWELCLDWYHEDYRGAPKDGSAWLSPPGFGVVIRGGSFEDAADACATTYRGVAAPDTRSGSVGFRVVCRP